MTNSLLSHGAAAARIFRANDRMNQLVIGGLDPVAWTARPPGRVRTIAALFTHMHNVRAKWIRLTAPHLPRVLQLHRTHCSPGEACAALAQSVALCADMLVEVLDNPAGRNLQFHRDGWASPWPPGPAILGYMLAHEAHHRGQACMLAHQLGFPLPPRVASGLWNWEKLLG